MKLKHNSFDVSFFRLYQCIGSSLSLFDVLTSLRPNELHTPRLCTVISRDQQQSTFKARLLLKNSTSVHVHSRYQSCTHGWKTGNKNALVYKGGWGVLNTINTCKRVHVTPL